MVPLNKSEQPKRFAKIVDRLVGAGKLLHSSSEYSYLRTSLDLLSNEIAELRSVAETPSAMTINGVPIIENDFYALRVFDRINGNVNKDRSLQINRSGRVHFLHHDSDSVSDVSPLAALTSLTYLSLPSNQIKDVSVLSSLKLLQTVSFNHNRGFDAQSLRELKNIRGLSVINTGVSELAWMTSLRELRRISLGKNNINNIQALAEIDELQEVHIESNPITSLEPLRHHPNLWSLCIADTLVEDLSPLLDTPKLFSLVISHAMCGRGDISEQLSRLEAKGILIERWHI